MLPGSIETFLRLAGILFSAILAVLPWYITPDSLDPFLFQSWAIFAMGAISICIFAVILIFFRPRNRQIPFMSSFIVIFTAVAISTIYSNFLVSLRSSMLIITTLLIVSFFRVSRQRKDNLSIAGMIILSGTLMGIYGILQYAGFDLLTWQSKYQMVGTLSNPNFYGSFLAITALFTLALSLDASLRGTRTRVIFLLFFVLQFFALILLNRTGTTFTFLTGLLLLFTHGWEVKPGKILRSSPFISGIILSLLVVIFHGLLFYASSNYPWDSLRKPPSRHFPIVSRLILWQMGYGVFLQNPFSGLGNGAVPYLLPIQRPPLGTALGIKTHNDDPHSSAITILAENGILGLIGVCSFLAVLYGCFVWRRFKIRAITVEMDSASIPPLQQVNANCQPLHWAGFLIVITGTLGAFLAKLLTGAQMFYILPLSIVVFGLHNAYITGTSDLTSFQLPNLAKATMVGLLAFCFDSLYNPSLSVLPIVALAVLLTGTHFSSCLRDLKWKRKFSLVSLLYLFFPAMYVFAVYQFQASYHIEQTCLSQGEKHLAEESFEKSYGEFKKAIKANPQSLKAHFGLATSLEKLNRLEESQDIFKRIDSMVPNAFNSNFELARLLLQRNQILEAHRHVLKSLEWNQVPRAYELLGRILVMEGKFTEAERVFREGLMLVPFESYEMESADRIRLNLAAMMANRGEFEQCESLLSAMTTSVREDIDVIYLRGMMLSRRKNLTEALELFEKGLKQAPDKPHLLNATGYILTELNIDLERARKLLERAHAIIKKSNPPNLSDLLMVAHSLGKLYWKTGKMNEARQLLQIAYDQSPSEWKILKKERLEDLNTFLNEIGEELSPEMGKNQ